MVMIVPHNKRPGALESFLSGLEPHVGDIFGKYEQRRELEAEKERQSKALQAENEALKRIYGVDYTGVSNPKIRELGVKNAAQEKFIRELSGGVDQNAALEEYFPEFQPQEAEQQEQLFELTPEMMEKLNNEEELGMLNQHPAVQALGSQPRQNQIVPRSSLTAPNAMKFSPKQLLGLAAINPQFANIAQRAQEGEAKRELAEKSQAIQQEQNERRINLAEKGQKEQNKLSTGRLKLEKKKHKFAEAADARTYEKDLIQAWKGAKEQEKIFDALEKGADERSVGTQLRKYASETLGLPESLFLNPSEEVQEKFGNKLIQGVSKIYKGRILDSEIKNYIKSNPSLWNTKEGQKRLGRIGKLDADLIIREHEIAQRLIKEHGKGKPYPRLEADVTEELDKIYDSVHEQALDIMSGRVPIPLARPGEKGNRELADKLIAKFNGDRTKAYNEMLRLGYEP